MDRTGHFAILASIALVAASLPPDDLPLSGDHVCAETRPVPWSEAVRVNIPVEMEVEESCPDIFKGFRCKVKKTGLRVEYHKHVTDKPESVQVCCPGYKEVVEKTCQPA